MFTFLIMLIVIMILGAIVALESRDLLSGIISLGIVGFALTIIFLLLKAPDLAIVQIIVETLTLMILIAAILKTSREDLSIQKTKDRIWIGVAGFTFCLLFLVAAIRMSGALPQFGEPVLRMATYYIEQGMTLTNTSNLVTAIILDFRAYDTLGEATVLFTSAIGVLTVLRKTGRKDA